MDSEKFEKKIDALNDKIINFAKELGIVENNNKHLIEKINSIEKNIDLKLKDLGDTQKEIQKSLHILIQDKHTKIGSLKMLSIVFGGLIVVSSFFAWIIDRWEIITNALL